MVEPWILAAQCLCWTGSISITRSWFLYTPPAPQPIQPWNSGGSASTTKVEVLSWWEELTRVRLWICWRSMVAIAPMLHSADLSAPVLISWVGFSLSLSNVATFLNLAARGIPYMTCLGETQKWIVFGSLYGRRKGHASHGRPSRKGAGRLCRRPTDHLEAGP